MCSCQREAKKPGIMTYSRGGTGLPRLSTEAWYHVTGHLTNWYKSMVSAMGGIRGIGMWAMRRAAAADKQDTASACGAKAGQLWRAASEAGAARTHSHAHIEVCTRCRDWGRW